MRSVIVMGHCQGIISHPDIIIFSRTVRTTGTNFRIEIFSFIIDFRGAPLIKLISNIKLDNIFLPDLRETE